MTTNKLNEFCLQFNSLFYFL